MKRFVWLAGLLVLALSAGAACGGEKQDAVGMGSGATSTVTGSASAGGGNNAASPAAGTTTATKTADASPVRKLGTYSGVATTTKAPDFTALSGATAVFGTLGKAVYQIEMPAQWNGEVVYYAHGFAGFGTEVAVDPPPRALREQLVAGGWAWAASSFSENGYTPGIGADDTLALKRFFEAKYGQVKRSYLAGASMGGNVVALSLEQFPNEYDGGLAVCGAVAGQSQIDFLTSWTALAEFTSGVRLPIGEGSSAGIGVLAQLSLALGSAETPTAKGKQFVSAVKMLTGGPRPFYMEGFKEQYLLNFGLLLQDFNRTTVAAGAATNEGEVYSIEPGLGLTAEQLNAGVRRFAANPALRDPAAHPDAVPTTGKISKPLLTLHGTGDLFVPISQEQLYRQRVDAAGKGDLLVQRIVRSAGHCTFSTAELTRAFTDLVAWVRSGSKPAGDAVLGDLSDAGRQFTEPLRPGDPGTK